MTPADVRAGAVPENFSPRSGERSMLTSLLRRGRSPAAALAVLTLTAAFLGADEGTKTTADPAKAATPCPGYVTVRFCDNSSLKVTVKDEALELTTKYGKMRVPVADIVQIDFATRVSPEVAKRID